MDTQTDARIYLADQRGCTETPLFRSYHTVNAGGYVAEGREPFGGLHLLNDDTIRAGASLTMQVEQPTRVLLLPVAGGFTYTVGESTTALDPGQVGLLSLGPGGTYRIDNRYRTEFINCLQIWLSGSGRTDAPDAGPGEFDLAVPNQLRPLFDEAMPASTSRYRGFIGRYDGRQEGTYGVEPAADGQARRLFVFVLQGAFEVANRLMQERDGLALEYSQGGLLEFEALSNDALLLLLDLG